MPVKRYRRRSQRGGEAGEGRRAAAYASRIALRAGETNALRLDLTWNISGRYCERLGTPTSMRNTSIALRSSLLALCLAAGAGRVYPQWVEDSIQVPGAWVGSLAYNCREDVLYGNCEQAGIYFAIDCDSDCVIASYPLSGAFVLAYDSTDNKAYCSYCGPAMESLAVIDGQTHQVIQRFEMPGSTNPVWDVVSDRVYVSCQSTNSVAVLDCRTDSLLHYIPVGACPIKMYLNTLRRKLYVLNYDAGSVSIVDLATNQVIKTVVVGGYPNAGYYCRSVDKFYSAGPHEQCVVLGGLSDAIVARIPLPGIEDVLGATGNEDAGLVYLGTFSGHDDYVAVVSAQRDSVLATALTGRQPFGLAYSVQSGLLYCASSWSDEVYVLTGDGARILRTLQVGNSPFVFADVPHHRRLYLGHLGASFVYVLRDTTAGISETGAPEARPREALVVSPNPFGSWVSVAGNPSDCPVRIYSTAGELVRTILPTRTNRPRQSAVWDGLNNDGLDVPDGVYLVEAAGVRVKVVKAK